MNYQDNATRKTGAISYLLFTSFGMSSNNTVQRAKFINAKPVYFPPMEQKWSNDDYGNTSYKTSVFHDKDGSISGVPNSYIVINDRNRHRRSLRGQAHLERCGVQGRYRAHDCWRAAAVLLGSAVVAQVWRTGGRGGAPGAVLQVAEVLAVRLAQLPPEPVCCTWLPLLWRQVVVGSEVALHLQPPVVLSRNGKEFTAHRCNQRTSGHRVQGNHRKADPCPSACRNWMPARG